MEGPTQQLLDFVIETNFEDLPVELVHESKRILLDCIGVAIAALNTDKGRYGTEMAKRFGVSGEASILGTADRVSCGAAAFANGELMNATDFDPAFFPTHAPPAIIPASLALAESVEASGKNLVLSIALGCEVAFRLGKALRGLKKVFTKAEGSEMGKVTHTNHSISAINVAVIAGAAGAVKMVKLGPAKVPHAIGLAAHFTPIPQSKWKTLARLPMTKYLSAGWASMAEVTAIILAEMGYTADTTPLDGELGFWKFFGSDQWDPGVLTKDLGRDWTILNAVEYKPYPCCRDFHVALDCFREIIEKNGLKPEDIEKVMIQTHPSVAGPMYRIKTINDHVETQFSLPYVISAAANRISLAEWQDPRTISDPGVLSFMDKVFQEAHSEFVEVQQKEPLSNMTTVEVKAGGKTFRGEGKYPKGLPRPEFARMMDEDLLEKFRANISKVLPGEKVNKSIEVLMHLEKVESISLVTELVTL
jgi:2-methylcitrate dehydratase PrpD